MQEKCAGIIEKCCASGGYFVANIEFILKCFKTADGYKYTQFVTFIDKNLGLVNNTYAISDVSCDKRQTFMPVLLKLSDELQTAIRRRVNGVSSKDKEEEDEKDNEDSDSTKTRKKKE